MGEEATTHLWRGWTKHPETVIMGHVWKFMDDAVLSCSVDAWIGWAVAGSLAARRATAKEAV